MEPTLLPGDLLLIDRRPIEKCRRDCIYAINHPEEGGTIKRCAVAGDRLILAPDNPAYSNVFIRLENVDLSSILVGTVVWTGRELKRS
jgi:phage repressor protein C with HTH and peptisase S24 domain